jgi:hypothetical protein
MKRSSFLALIAVLPLRLSAADLSSADYQAAIREATERYRGDCTERTVVTERYSFHGSLSGDICDKYLHTFDALQFTLSLLPHFTPNPAMQLTPSRTEFTFHND